MILVEFKIFKNIFCLFVLILLLILIINILKQYYLFLNIYELRIATNKKCLYGFIILFIFK